MSHTERTTDTSNGWSEAQTPAILRPRTGDVLVAAAATLNPVLGPSLDPTSEIKAFHRFHYRLTLLYGGAVILTLALLVFVFYELWTRSEIESLQARLLTLSSSLAHSVDADKVAGYGLKSKELTDFHLEVYKQFESMAERDPDIDSIYILRPSNVPTDLYFFVDYAKGELVGEPGEYYSAEDTPVMLKGFNRSSVENVPYRDEFGYTLSAYSPLITRDGRHIGIVGVDVKAERLSSAQHRILIASGAIFLVSFFVIAIVSWVVSRSIREPLRRLIHGTGAVASGNLDVRMHMQRVDEFGLLGKHFDKMADELKERQTLRDLFGRYLSEDVARSVLSQDHKIDLGGEEVVVTVLFCDIKDYTTISERLSPLQMVSMLNEYLGVMNSIIDQHGGCVIEFLGDGILAVFGAPQSFSDHAERATRCALAMRQGLESLNKQWLSDGLAQRWQALGISEIEFRIGMHTGLVVAGNLGSKTRMKYAVIGDTVNVAARLEHLNKEYQSTILISEEVKSRLPNDVADLAQRKGEATVKGRTQTVEIYSL
ncbi:HAMP domain-containing protein [Ketobacter sp. MCCC 1A13808]|uniref:adenylate/guanylate cyclase domain-containing protein n=1 Tax=Ketobacter sp. MCCC 1A13808 TaxID=2602738 RepID=UPI000F10A182|nr:adenylate/guanylate cyclase domain-containing protein [Ketobacter sp. MCCC 1A13808]MVF12632.1 HAMP domain-containing protein [Ketobacter sp. MCCC 1A13808]RLP55572.1 MAG: HAMP domain-containing protein [Ketobacter sp.]